MGSNLSDRVAWITGSQTGIGRALALEFARRGATVVATCIGGAQASHSLDVELRALSDSSRVLEQDVTRECDALRVAEQIAAHRPQALVLINNAGIYPGQAGGKDRQ